jgi:hypothetical protein
MISFISLDIDPELNTTKITLNRIAKIYVIMIQNSHKFNHFKYDSILERVGEIIVL